MDTSNTITLSGQADQAQIDAWKADNSNPYGIYGVKVAGKIIYFRYPTLTDLNCAYAKTDHERQMDKWQTLADTTFVGGCEEVLKNDRLFVSIIPYLQEAAKGEEAELVNL